MGEISALFFSKKGKANRTLVNQVDRRGETPLHLAETPLIAKLLLDAGADPLAMNKAGSTPLHTTYSVGVIEALLVKADINIRNRKGRTVLMTILTSKRFRYPTDWTSPHEKALRVLDLGVDPSITDNNGDGILHYLASRGITDGSSARPFFERLIQSGIDVNLRNNEGRTATHQLNSIDWPPRTIMADLQVMIELTNVDLNVVDNDGNTCLFHLIDNAKALYGEMKEVDSVMTTMAKAGARFDVTDKRGRTLLHAALQHIYNRQGILTGEEILKVLVKQGVDPKQTDNKGNTIWHVVVSRVGPSTQSVKLFNDMTALGVDVRKSNNHGRLPLHLFCEDYRHRHENDFDCRSKDGTTVFDYILEQGHEDINRADNDGVLPVHLASTFSTSLMRMILDAEPDITLATNEGLNVFHLAARCRQSNTIGLLLEWSREKMSTDKIFEGINAKDKRGRSPLYYACVSGHYQSVELLIKAGAAIDLETYEGSPLHGCVEFEKEFKERASRGTSAFNAVHLGDPTRSEKDRPTQVPETCRSDDRIDEILDLIITNTTSASWREIDRAIAEAANQQHDYTVESLLRVRESSGMEEPLSCAAEVQSCLQRRASVLASLSEGQQAGTALSDQIAFLFEHRFYHVIPSFIEVYSPKPGIKDLYSICLKLVHGGYVGLLDTLLTPDLVSDIEKCSSPTAHNSRRRTDQDMTSLLIAACQSRESNLSTIKMLVKKGAKLAKSSEPNRATPLHDIVRTRVDSWWQTAEVLPYILDQDIDLEVLDCAGRTPMNASLQDKDNLYWNCQATEMLLRAGADPSSVDNYGKSCLAYAAGNKSLFRLLLRYGVDDGPGALAAAIVAKDTNMLEMILASGADPNARKVSQEMPSLTAPHRRSMGSQMEDPHDQTVMYALDLLITTMGYNDHDDVCEGMVKLLLEHGADPNSRYQKTTVAHRIIQGKNPYPSAASHKRNRYVDVILQHPALDVNLKDAAGTTLLQAAYGAGDLKASNALVDRDCDILARGNDGKNILHVCLESQHWKPSDQGPQDFLERLVTLGPELLHQVDMRGKTPLHYCLQRCSYQGAIDLLVSKGADVCAKDADGNTPLHLLFGQLWTLTVTDDDMVLNGSKKRLADIFLSRGADINARNKAGETPIFSYFRGMGIVGRVPKDKVIKTPGGRGTSYRVHDDVERRGVAEYESIVWALMDEFGVDWNVVNDEGQSLLHVVAGERKRLYDGRQRKFKLLMEKGLNVLQENNMHQTALDVAAANGAEDIIALFNVE